MLHHRGQEPIPPTILGWLEELVAPLVGRVSRRRVRQWCRHQGFQLVKWRDAKLFEGPSNWTASYDPYRIQIVDQEGQPRTGYVVFRRWWGPAKPAQVLWDEPQL